MLTSPTSRLQILAGMVVDGLHAQLHSRDGDDEDVRSEQAAPGGREAEAGVKGKG